VIGWRRFTSPPIRRDFNSTPPHIVVFSFLRFLVFLSVRELSDVVAYIDLLVFLCILLCRCVYVCDYVRASVSGLLRPFLSCGFYPLNLHSFIPVDHFGAPYGPVRYNIGGINAMNHYNA